MLKKIAIVVLAFAASALVAFLDFSYFKVYPWIFAVHHIVVLGIGSSLIYFSYRLLKNNQGNKYINALIIVFGIVQITIHLMVLIIGRC